MSHCNSNINNKLIESLIEKRVAGETEDLKYLQDSIHEFVNTLKEIILGEYSTEFFNSYMDKVLKLHDSNVEEFLSIPSLIRDINNTIAELDSIRNNVINLANQGLFEHNKALENRITALENKLN